MKRLNRWLYVVLMFLAAGCDKENAPDIIKTRGDRVIEQKELPAFHSFTVYNGINVVVRQGEHYEAALDGWKNLMPKIRLTVDSLGMLTIKDDNKFNMVRNRDNATTVYLTLAGELAHIKYLGNGDITSEDTLRTSGLSLLCEESSGSVNLKVRTPSLQLGTSNSVAPVVISGVCNSLGITDWGYGPSDFSGLRVLYADVHHHGTGNVSVNVSETLNVVLYGLGDVYYRGDPSIKLTRKGKGNLKKAD